jgi:hypothetical protein
MHKIYISGKVIVSATGHSADCAPCSWSLFNQSLYTETLLKYSLQSLTCRVREISAVYFVSFTAAGEQRKPLTAGEINNFRLFLYSLCNFNTEDDSDNQVYTKRLCISSIK